MTFEYYLQEKHAEQYIGLDDEMPDDFTDWLCELDTYDVIAFAETWHKKKLRHLLKI